MSESLGTIKMSGYPKTEEVEGWLTLDKLVELPLANIFGDGPRMMKQEYTFFQNKPSISKDGRTLGGVGHIATWSKEAFEDTYDIRIEAGVASKRTIEMFCFAPTHK
jgi:hypothetical protein